MRSTDRILTTHAGSLPRPDDIVEMMRGRTRGEKRDAAADAARIKQAVGEVVRKQSDIGIDIVDDGEFSKPSFVTYVRERLGGLSEVGGERTNLELGRLARCPRLSGLLSQADGSLHAAGSRIDRGDWRRSPMQGAAALASRSRQSEGCAGEGERCRQKRSCRRYRRPTSRTGTRTDATRPARNFSPRSAMPCTRSTRRSSMLAFCICRSTIRGL